jgi:uncharacterized protein YukE
VSDVLEVPVPSGDLALVQDAVADLERRAQRFHEAANEVDRLAQRAAPDWEGRTSAAFEERVGAARRALDAVAETQVQTAGVVRGYCEQWEETDRVARAARSDIESAASTYRRDGKTRAQHLADEISRAIESLDDPVEDIPIVGDIAGAATSGAAKIAHEFVERLLSWDPQPPQPTLHPVAPGDLGDLTSMGQAIGDAAEWGVGALLDGIDAVIDLVGGIVHAAVQALEAVGEAFVDAIETAIEWAGDALETLYDLGKEVATAIGDFVSTVAQVVFDAVVDAVSATIDFLISIGKGVWDVIEFVLDGVALIEAAVLAAILGAIRRKVGANDRRIEDGKRHDSAAFRELFDPVILAEVKERQDLADSAYQTSGAPEGWERVENYAGSDGFFAVAFRKKGTDTVVVAYRGTDGDSVKDWREDAFNAADLPTNQARQAIDVATSIANDPRFKGSDIEYTGHSLGGSLASIASVATGNPAKTFNAASIGEGNYALALAAGGHGRSEEQIVNYHTAPDVLTGLQDGVGIRPAAGAQVTIDSTTADPVSAHALDTFDWSKFEQPKTKIR